MRALRLARAKFVKYIQHPLGADAAEGAFAARLVLGELEKIARDVHHARRIIQHDHPARTHDGAGLAQRFVIHRRVHQASRHAAARRPANLHRLDPPALRRAAADFFDNVAQRGSHRHFDQPAAADFSGQGKDLGPLAFGRAERGEFLRPVPDDPGRQRQRFYVVNQRRFSPQARLGREGRPQPGYTAPALHRRDQGRFLAADKRAGAFDHAQPQSETPRPASARPASRAFPFPRWPPARA